MELSIEHIRPNELALWQGVHTEETEDGSVSKDLILVMSLQRRPVGPQLRDCCNHASKHSCKGVTLSVPTRFRSRIFKSAEFSCAQKLSKWAFFSLDLGWRPDVSALRTFILARSKRDLAAPKVMSRTHAVSAVLRFLTSFYGESVNRTPQRVTQFFPSSASQAISRHVAAFPGLGANVAIWPHRDSRRSVRLIAIAAKTFSKLAAVTGSVLALIPLR